MNHLIDRLLGALGVVFVVLKLTNTIDWSWWYVTMPFYGPFAVLLIILLISYFLSIKN